MCNVKEMAIRDLETLNVLPECVAAFEKNESVWCSERQILNIDKTPRICGVLYDAETPNYTFYAQAREAIARVRKDGFLPYHIVQTDTSFGNLFAVLYASENDQPISSRDCDAEYGYVVPAYVYNSDDNMLSEYGYICIKSSGGGIVRTA